MNKDIKVPLLFFFVFFIALLSLYAATSFSENAVIRRTLFLNGHPVKAFTVSIQNKPDYKEKRYGECYEMHDKEVNDGTENAIPGICMKKRNSGFIYYVTIGVY